MSGEEETESMPIKHKICKNQYLAIQDVCDETSMLAYNLIGRLMLEFAKTRGSDLNPSQISYLQGDDQMGQGIGSFLHRLSSKCLGLVCCHYIFYEIHFMALFFCLGIGINVKPPLWLSIA